MEVQGGCYCGAVRYQSEGDSRFNAQCHCRECQYLTGGSPNVFMAMPLAGFSYTKGAPKTFTRSDIDNPVTREFCGECGTHLTTRAPGMADAVILKIGSMDDPGQFPGPQVAIYCLDKQSFHAVPEGVAEFERLPG
ncbi:MAG: GFA family protein [Pseudomonadales bacterium]|jgi:hypothetical protein